VAGKIPSERSFGLSVGLASIALAALLAWRGRDRAAMIVAAIGVVLVAGGLVAPAALRLPNRIWWRFATVLGWINSRILLTLFFFAVLTPTGLLMRLFGRSPLRPAHDDTNWSGYDERRRETRHYEHLY
jgi:saxitoxin biosynthesis operon SxtJ-like protein